MEKTILTSDELGKVQAMNNEFTKAKMALGDLEMQKQVIINSIDGIKLEFSKVEMELISKYGKDSVINIQTGEVTKKEN